MMGTNRKKGALFIFIFISSFYSSNGCWMEGVDSWILGTSSRIKDTFRGNVFDRETRDIDGIVSYTFIDGLNSDSEYFTVSLTENRFVIATSDAFDNYEEYETLEELSVTLLFRCSGGSNNILVFLIQLEDTNNHDPRFLEDKTEGEDLQFSLTNNYAYTITTPVPPGFTVTGCSGITVRDVDLTTYAIDFTIEDNPYFEIEYDEGLLSEVKEFKGVLRAKTFIRTLPEPITLEIIATDADRTDDPRRHAIGSVTISANPAFVFPDEPVFTQPFYLANYTDEELVFSETITLQRGFDDLVEFSLEETEFSEYFRLVPDEDRVSITVFEPLPPNILRENQILLVVRADRNYTSGTSATIVVQPPEVMPLEFEKALYEGEIYDGNLRVPELILSQGYQGETINVEVFGEHDTFFEGNVEGNTITLSMEGLTDTIINENNVVSLEIVASTQFSTARTIVTLEIIKDDNVTPVFNKPVYTGSYTEAGLTIEPILLDQGYEDPLNLFFEEDEFSLFTVTRDGPIVTVTVTNIPADIFYKERIVLVLRAAKPRTVGANAIIDITLPAARQLGFQENTYRGTLRDNIVSLDTIVLNTGYDGTVEFALTGEHKQYFDYLKEDNRLTLTLYPGVPIPPNIIQDNNLIILHLEASGLNAVTTTTTILLDILKEDNTTPTFAKNIYFGMYGSVTSFVIEDIYLAQGFDDDVRFDLIGEHADYFRVTNDGSKVEVSLRSEIPPDLIFREKVLSFNVIATKPLTVGANAAILIRFPSELTDPAVMRFEQNTYEATFENNILHVDDIILTEGYASGTQFLLAEGDYTQHFELMDIEQGVSLKLNDSLPIDEIENSFIVLDLEARRESAVSVWTSIVIDIVRQKIEPLVFSQPFYQGVYVEETDDISVETISLASGHDETVTFDLEGELASLFTFTGPANLLTITNKEPLSDEVLAGNSHLLLVVVATKPNAIEARATVSITIEREHSETTILRFDQKSYVGSLENGELDLEPITLIEGYTSTVALTLRGALEDYFTATWQSAGVVSVTRSRDIPDDLLPPNRIIVLQIEASLPGAIAAHATIVLEVVVDDDQPSAPRLGFGATYYTGTYTAGPVGLVMDSTIVLAEGYDATVAFDVEGEHSEWFVASGTGGTVTLTVREPIPAGILVRNQPLVFVLTAARPGSDTARAAIVISLPDEQLDNAILSFNRVTYVGSLENGELDLEPITLIEGYTSTVALTLRGALEDYFTATWQSAGVVSVTRSRDIPDDLLPPNRIIVLQIEASLPGAIAAHATIVLKVVVDDDQPSAPRPGFGATYYTGTYTAGPVGLVMDSTIVLTEGYDATVAFDVEGEHSEWFVASGTGGTVTLTVREPIPAGILVRNQPLVFVLTAARPGSDTARAAIVISLPDEQLDNAILSFNRVTYVGSLENGELDLEPITLIEGYTSTVALTLRGALEDYFTATWQSAGVVSVTRSRDIPDDLLPPNRIIVLQIEASLPGAIAAHATIVLEVVVDDDQPSAPRLGFGATYYTGTYTAGPVGLVMDSTIVLAEGYDATVAFDVEGEHSEWFVASGTGGTVTLTVREPIPAGILVRNQPLVFVLTAARPGSDTARAAIVISLPDEQLDNAILSFNRVTYVGSLENGELDLEPITLIEGYTSTVALTLRGALEDYFTATWQSAGVVSVTRTRDIPDDLLPPNRIIVLQIEASLPGAIAAHATIVLEVVVDDNQPSAPRLGFGATYYTGTYTAGPVGLVMDSTIVLAEGYDATVAFDVEGEHSEWFVASGTGGTVTLTVREPIPAGILVRNQPLVFVLTAARPGSDTARAAIVISLPDEQLDNAILSFNRVTYVGSLENGELDLEPITLIEGYTSTVALTLRGALEDYFTATWQSAGVVSVTRSRDIPDDLLPPNRIIVLQIEASLPGAIAAHATIVFEVVVDDDQPSAPRLGFGATYYTGTYTAGPVGLVMDSTIVLAEGYDATVAFDVEGEHSEWFVASGTGGTVTLTVREPIPAGILVRNQPLVFVLTAARPGSDTARAAIVISLPDEQLDNAILSFNRVTYVGSLENGELDLEPITLIEGYTSTVALTLRGALEDYFTATWQSAGVVSVTRSRDIPDDLLPPNRIIVLQIEASLPGAIAAHATIVLEVVVDDDQPSAPRPGFGATYYTGTYTAGPVGLVMDSTIVLTEGYDATVAFDVEGEHSEWFVASGTGGTVTLTVREPIPAGILVRNQPLVFVLTAARPGSDTARAAIVISLPDEQLDNAILSFNRVTYVGSLENGELDLEPITLIEGYTSTVALTLRGALEDYFTATWQSAGVVSVTRSRDIPDDLLPPNRIIVLQIEASLPGAIAAHATIVLEVVVDDDQPSAPRLGFGATYYTGTYTAGPVGLVMDSTIVLAEGYDATVAFDVEGEHSEWFVASGTGGTVTLTVREPIPAGILVRNQPLVFVLTAARPGSDTARAAIVISLPDEQLDNAILSFNRVTYVGSLENGELDLEPITLIEGYTSTVALTLRGALEDYFTATWQSAGVVSVTRTRDIPDDLLPPNRIIVLQIEASLPGAIAAHATIVLEVVVDDNQPSAPRLGFGATYYTGTYTAGPVGLVMDSTIVLAEGYDATVAFDVEGEHSEWFVASGTGGTVTLTVREPIPAGILVRNQPLVFVLTAARPGSDTARAAIVISLPDEQLDNAILSFNRVTYVGSLENGELDLEPITLIEGYTSTVALTLRGALEDYFTATWQSAGVVSVTRSRDIPDDLLPPNRIIVLQIEASLPGAIAAHATIVFEVVVDDDQPSAPRLGFGATYYTGTYTAGPVGLVMDSTIVLAEGYDATVAFDVEGEHSEWFVASGTGGTVTLTVREPIPAGILVRNQPLVFVLTAARPGSDTARAAIVISLPDEQLDNAILSFNRVTYVGSLENGELDLEPITLIEGYTSTVALTLRGALEDYFTATWQSAGVVSVTRSRDIPDDLLPPNRIIVLQIEASLPGAIAAHATIVLEVVVDDDQPSAPRLGFGATYYTGTYTAGPVGLVMDSTIVLAEGYDATVAFDVEGEHSEWFVASGTGGTVTLTVREPIPAGILVRNQPLVFVLTAARPGSDTARAAIVISLPDEQLDNAILSFNRVTYVGSLENGELDLEPITLIEGYTSTVALTLRGALEDYFTATWQSAGVVSVTRSRDIPDDLLPPNRIIVLQIEASLPGAIAAHATIVFEVVVDDDQPSAPRLGFGATYYTGTYTAGPVGLVMDSTIVLAEGYDATVAFDVEGEHSEWFVASGTGGTVTLTVREPIPAGILVRNQPLVFVLTAARPGSDTARAAIVISLPDEQLDNAILSFNRVTYVGSLENGELDLEPITLIEGYTSTVALTLRGALEDYFTATWQSAGVVSVTRSRDIPDDLLPPNRIIVLQIEASLPGAIAAHATIVLEVVVDDDQPSAPRPGFGATYYTGTYTAGPVGLVMDSTIVLTEGYDATVAFDVEGEHSEWFVASGTGGTVTLTVREPIPAGILVRNQPLVFVLTAARPGSDTARAAIVISLPDEQLDNAILSFNRVTYVGSLENGELDLEPITLIEGYTSTVALTLRGALEDYFTATWQSAGVVSVTRSRDIPDDLLPPNRIIVLQIEASLPGAIAAHATIVLEVVVDDDQPSAPRLGFGATYYTGTYTAGPVGLVMDSTIVLAEGYDATVAFDVEGEHSEWFVASGTGGTVTLTVREPIPAGILVRNQPLVFVLTAARPGSDTARAAIVISLPDEQLDNAILSFNRVTYVGSLENGELDLEPITLIEGYTSTVALTLRGALEDYFTATWQSAGVVSVTRSRDIPDDLLPPNRIIVLQIEASLPGAIAAHATIVLEVVVDDDQPSAPRLGFGATYYTGTYTAGPVGLVMDSTIVLAEGYDATVAFDVEGEHSEWFVASGTGGTVTLTVREPIPAGILVRNQPLVFVLTAARPGSDTARAAIVISLPDEQLDNAILSFNRVTYVGSLENGELDLEPITLIEGYTSTVALTLRGALEDYFTATWQSAGVVSVTRSRDIPDDLLPPNRIIVLQIEASLPGAIAAHATIVLEVVVDDDQPSAPRLGFGATYYTGTYTAGPVGLVMDSTIVLAEGYDATVAFDVEGEHSEWFVASGTGGTVTLTVREPIPAGILVRNQPLVFVLTAARPGSDTARAAIVISLPDEQLDNAILSFNRVTYVGSLENGELDLEPITLIEGYTSTVALTLRGALEDYFTATWQSAGVVSVTRSRDIPDDLLPPNRIIVLQIEASLPGAIAAHATIVLEVVVDDDQPSAPRLGFGATYYTGTYTAGPVGLVMDSTIVLTEGYDATVAFDVEGEHSEWFVASGTGGTVTLTVRDPIPAGILVRNQPLVFVLTAARPGSDTARAAIVISLPDEQLDNALLSFNRVTYVGSLENGELDLEPITLIEGYTSTVALTLRGALEDYFTATWQSAGVVSVTRSRDIPDDLLPPNRIIVLQIEASLPGAIAAHATIVLEVVVDDDQPSAPRLGFGATYYTGTYTAGPVGLVMDSTIVLTEGYDATVAFDVEGEHSEWFVASGTGGTVTLTVREPIPAGILVRNQPLVFVLTAARPGSDTARAAIVISLPDEQLDNAILSFNRVTYVGSLENGELDLEPITLIEGYTSTVALTLRGALEDYFTATWQSAGVVSVTRSRDIPDDLLPPNRIIVLQIEASLPGAIAAHATIVLEVVVDDDQPSAPRLGFGATYYTGTYTAGPVGLVMDSTIVLTEGYDATVAFDVEGEHSEWFVASGTGGTVTLTVREPIPAGILVRNQPLVFVLTAARPGSDTARAAIVISLPDEQLDNAILSFNRVTYVGSLENGELDLEPITLIEGYTSTVALTLRGALEDYFTATWQSAGVVSVTRSRDIPDDLLPPNRIIVLQIEASLPGAIAAHATIVLEVVVDDDQPSAPRLGFGATYYTGTYTAGPVGLVMDSTIVLTEGYDATVAFDVEGEHSEWFVASGTGGTVTLTVREPIPAGILVRNQPLVFLLTAARPGSDTARAAIVISLPDEQLDNAILSFNRVTYVGSLENGELDLEPITLIEGYTSTVALTLRGALEDYFTATWQSAGVVSVTRSRDIPDDLLPPNRIIVLQIEASLPGAIAAHATIVLEVVVDDDQPSAPRLGFGATYYTGTYTAGPVGLVMDSTIVLAEGYDATVAFDVEGEHSEWFVASGTGGTVTLTVREPIPAGILVRNQPLVFVLTAARPGSDTARAAIVISLPDEQLDNAILSFNRVTYVGSLENGELDLEPITLIEGYTSTVALTLRGALEDYFTATWQSAGVVSVTRSRDIPDDLLPPNRIIVLQIEASLPGAIAAHATIVLEVVVDDDQPSAPRLEFDASYYTGTYTAGPVGLVMDTPIILAEGYDAAVVFDIEGEHSEWFSASPSGTGNTVTLSVRGTIPGDVLANYPLLLVLTADRPGSFQARAVIIISVDGDSQIGDDVSFERLVYEGIIQLSTVQHEMIIISNFNGDNVDVFGKHSDLFVARVANGVVTVQASGSVTLPNDVAYVILELHAGTARAVLLLDVEQSVTPVPPTVTFSSPSYAVKVEIVQTGLVGRVSATADNGEAVTYALAVNDAHLQARISVNNEGELHLSAPANSGVYIFEVVATTVITQAEGRASIHLTVEAITVCGDNEIVVPPLIILDRDEEQAHNNLVTLAGYENCQFTLTNRWPLDQNWLFVDSNGLHARSIDREHESIAHMAQSQVQVELILHCESDTVSRTKRSLRTDWLGPYDYGTNKWILSDSISYNSRRSFVNLIVNDINDNYPIFVGKEREPIVVGYPIAELEERILPRSLAELQATDADIGENAALMYWSSDDVLSVAPTTGFVHVRTGARLENDQRLTISATDQNGQGLTGHIQLMVKLLDLNNIVVITVKDAFLHDESTVLAQLSASVGYEMKVLKAVVVSEDFEDGNAVRTKRETTVNGPSLLLYVYGLLQSEPVSVDRLTADINSNAEAVSVISTKSLEDHLEPNVISENNVGLLVSTIVLGVLLFILLVLIGVWFFLKWRKNRNYETFSDANSLASRTDSVDRLPKPEIPKPRLNIEDLKRSERRLQDMLNAPIEEVMVEAIPPRKDPPVESIVDLLSPESNIPIVIQSIDKLKSSEESDEDEFGEKISTRRKSVVTFNENVEKIIHVEDDEIDTMSSESSYEVYKL